MTEKHGKSKTGYEKLEGGVAESLGELVKEKEYYEKELEIAEKNGDRKTAGTCYERLGCVFHFLGEYVKAKECYEKALVIAKKNGDRETKDASLQEKSFRSFGEDVNDKEDDEKFFETAEKSGDCKTEPAWYEKLGTSFECLGADIKAKTYDHNVDKKKIGKGYSLLGACFAWLSDFTKAKEYLNYALALCRKTGDEEGESFCQYLMSLTLAEEGKIFEARSHFFASVDKSETIEHFLQDRDDQSKVMFFERFVENYRRLSKSLCAFGDHNYHEGLCMEELGRARALADLISSRYSVENEMSVNLKTWVDLEKIVKKERNCLCLYISYFETFINLWVIKADEPLLFRRLNVNEHFLEEASVSRIEDLFWSNTFREEKWSPPEHSEDRSRFPLANACSEQAFESSQGDSLAVLRLIEEDKENQRPFLSLADGYNIIIAPVADLLDRPEIIIVPDRLFYKVPFAALKNERGNYLSENFRIRIVPSLTTLGLIQDSAADCHSQSGALIVGDPDIEQEMIWRLPFAREEAMMIGKLLGTQPLLGKQATKQAVLQKLNSVSLIHFACHGGAEKGELLLASPPLNNRKLKEEDFVLKTADISQVKLRAKLVVLSCCHSGLGQIRAEGVVGIARAFLGSGARSVLVALWAIQDLATMHFMCRFYEHLVRGESASESLHQAMRWMRENGFSLVKQWAAFMLIGDNVTLDFHKVRLIEIL